ncbi:MAG: ribonuclease III [Planctomycetota bacterium]|nr:ribonuclease III [Planctomycetota bacterium]
MTKTRSELSEELFAQLSACEERVGYSFQDRLLLLAALTHASSADHRLASNERLEFLGDAILGAVVCEYLYHRFPRYLEGDLTKIKSVIVSRQSCAQVSRKLGLQEFLIVGKGMSQAEDVPPSLLSDVFESLVAAVHLDGGPDASREFVERHVQTVIEEAVRRGAELNHKSQLQQRVQRELGFPPTYDVIEETGPDHSKSFKISARIGDRLFFPAIGRNKKEAEQRAAGNALAELADLPPPYNLEPPNQIGLPGDP